MNAQPDPAPAAPEASETAWRAWLADTGAAHWKTVALKLLRRAFMAGWDSGLQQAAADPQPPGPEGGF